jgi:hypothetical protein
MKPSEKWKQVSNEIGKISTLKASTRRGRRNAWTVNGNLKQMAAAGRWGKKKI